MKQAITQKLDYGCGVACFAFVCDMTFQEAVTFLGREYSVKHGWRSSDLVTALNRYGLNYKNRYVHKINYRFISRSDHCSSRTITHPSSRALFNYIYGRWMDPWINMADDNDVTHAVSGFRAKLPSKPMYALTVHRSFVPSG